MSEVKKKQLLLINMEYTQDEINEPINVDILLNCLPKDLFDSSNVTVVYRDIHSCPSIEICRYDIVLISTKLSSFFQLDLLLNSCNNKIVIVGGILAICVGDQLATRYPNCIFNTGEGETNLNSLLQLASTCQDLESFKQAIIENNIPNVCFYYQPMNNIFHTERIVCDLKLQQYPKHNTLKHIIASNGLVRMETSRGCPWNKCSFCIMPWKFSNESWRPYSKDKIEGEIKYLVQNGASQILFTDEDFVGNYEHLSELCDIIEKVRISHQKDISFGGSTSVMTLFSLGKNLEYCLKRMYDVGINLIFIGVESGCDSQLQRYNKGVTASTNEKIINQLRQYNFEIDFGFILFDADTTMIELEENLNFINRTGLRCSTSRFAKKLRVTPCTHLCDDYKSRKIIGAELDINDIKYEYAFCDSNIALVCSFIEKLDNQVLHESYQLQAIMRSTVTQEKKDIAHERLSRLREIGYNFLRQCVDLYKEMGILHYNNVLELYQTCICRGGINHEEYKKI